MKSQTVSHGRRRSGQSGQSLIELLTVVAIVGLIASIAAQGSVGALDQARTSRTMKDMRAVSDALMQVMLESEQLPEGSLPVAALQDLLEPYLRVVPTQDAWGNPLWYEGVSGAGDFSMPSPMIPADPQSPQSAAPPSSPSSPGSEPPDDDDDGDDDGDDDDGDDGGGHPFGGGGDGFQLVSFGKDGVPDGDIVTGRWLGYYSDVVLDTGSFVQSKW